MRKASGEGGACCWVAALQKEHRRCGPGYKTFCTTYGSKISQKYQFISVDIHRRVCTHIQPMYRYCMLRP